ncbi:Thioesterase domain containing protein [Parasponia andersonii]|uniref:Thioesterase domain containing protein n=1 Tax=Parasponia andersonii TaxID=3476 RepID=A0A2P5BVV0_PARAD|nr:Thioesterase domain containing protein [Parasponia andersonii]
MADSIRESVKEILSPTVNISSDLSPEFVDRLLLFLAGVGVSTPIPDHCDTKGFFSDVVSATLKPLSVSPGHVSCLLTVKPVVTNFYATLHGGALAAAAEAISIACARTVVAEDKELFLGEQSMSYLSSAPQNAEVIADGKVVRSGRNLTVVAVDFRLKKTQKLVYTARSTFYNMPVAKL